MSQGPLAQLDERGHETCPAACFVPRESECPSGHEVGLRALLPETEQSMVIANAHLPSMNETIRCTGR